MGYGSAMGGGRNEGAGGKLDKDKSDKGGNNRGGVNGGNGGLGGNKTSTSPKKQDLAPIKDILDKKSFPGFNGIGGPAPKSNPTTKDLGIPGDALDKVSRGISGPRGPASYNPSLMGKYDDVPTMTEGDWGYGWVNGISALATLGPLSPISNAIGVATGNTLADNLGMDPGVHTGGTDVDRDTNPGRYGGGGSAFNDRDEYGVGEASRARGAASGKNNSGDSPGTDILYGDDSDAEYSGIRMRDRRKPYQSATDLLGL